MQHPSHAVRAALFITQPRIRKRVRIERKDRAMLRTMRVKAGDSREIRHRQGFRRECPGNQPAQQGRHRQFSGIDCGGGGGDVFGEARQRG